MSTATTYTVTKAAPQQPSSLSFEVVKENPQVKVSGLKSPGAIEVLKSHDGSDPTDDDATGVIYRTNGVRQLIAAAGHKVIFKGFNLEAADSVTVEIEAS